MRTGSGASPSGTIVDLGMDSTLGAPRSGHEGVADVPGNGGGGFAVARHDCTDVLVVRDDIRRVCHAVSRQDVRGAQQSAQPAGCLRARDLVGP